MSGRYRRLIAQAAWEIPQPGRFRGGGSRHYLNTPGRSRNQVGFGEAARAIILTEKRALLSDP